MIERRKNQLLTYFIAAVWLTNGLFCKVFNLVPRHQMIVAAILGNDHARLLTVLIGLSEIGMALWIVSRYWARLNAVTQIIVVVIMNTLEYLLLPDLLLWGRFNSLWAFLFVVLIFYNVFILNRKPKTA